MPNLLRRCCVQLPLGLLCGWAMCQTSPLAFWPVSAPTVAGESELERAYALWRTRFPNVEAKGEWIGNDCSKQSIVRRFQALSQIVGLDAGLEMVAKEPIILMWCTDSVRESWDALKELEDAEETAIVAEEVLKKNPRLLTIGAKEIRSGNLKVYDITASVLDLLRPLGPFGVLITRPLGLYILCTMLSGLASFLQSAQSR